MDNGCVDWRRIIYSINRQFIARISWRTDSKKDVRCLIIDDTELPKRGMKAEGLGRAISHVAMKSILGYKTMSLCNTDVKFQFMLDGTIQAEAGKNRDKPQGLTTKQKAVQSHRWRNTFRLPSGRQLVPVCRTALVYPQPSPKMQSYRHDNDGQDKVLDLPWHSYFIGHHQIVVKGQRRKRGF